MRLYCLSSYNDVVCSGVVSYAIALSVVHKEVVELNGALCGILRSEGVVVNACIVVCLESLGDLVYDLVIVLGNIRSGCGGLVGNAAVGDGAVGLAGIGNTAGVVRNGADPGRSAGDGIKL